MSASNPLERVKERAAELNRYSIRLWLVLSLILSLAAIVILSKRHPASHGWVFVAALSIPISLTLYFRNRIVLFGPFVYVGALIVLLGAAVLFGL